MNDETRDLYALAPDAVKEPPHSFSKAIRQIGPGLILAASIVGTGELINTTSLGAQAGFSLLWLIVFSCVIKVFVQVELGRYAITHGKTTLAAFDSLPGPRAGVSWLCWLWLIMMLTTQAQIAAMEGAVGQAAHMAFPGAAGPIAAASSFLGESWKPYLLSHQEHFWAAITTLAAILLLLSGGYRRLEKITTVLVAAVTLFTVASVLILQWTRFRITTSDLAQGFKLELPAAAVILAFSAFGITGVGASELFAYPYWCIEKGYARFTGVRSEDEAWARRARGWTRVMQLDAWFSMIVFTVATVAFYFLGAAVLHPQRLDPKGPEMLKTLSLLYLDPLTGTPLSWLAPFSRVGFLAGSLGSALQDALRRHGGQQPAHGRLSPPDRFLEIGGAGRARPPGQVLLRTLSHAFLGHLLRLPRAERLDHGRWNRSGTLAPLHCRCDALPAPA